jgi:hypothetical protein
MLWPTESLGVRTGLRGVTFEKREAALGRLENRGWIFAEKAPKYASQRGLDLPFADHAVFHSPKTHPITMWQEMARIRVNDLETEGYTCALLQQ